MDHGAPRDSDAAERRTDLRDELEQSLGADAGAVARRIDAYREASEADDVDLARLRDRLDSGPKPSRRPRAATWLLCAAAASIAFALLWNAFSGGSPGDSGPKHDVVADDNTKRPTGSGPGIEMLTVVALTGQLFAERDEEMQPVKGSTEVCAGTKLRAGDKGCQLSFGPDNSSSLRLTSRAAVKVVCVQPPCFEFEEFSGGVEAQGDVDFVVHGERFRCRKAKARVVPCCGSSRHAATVTPANKGVMICGAPQSAHQNPKFRSCNVPHYVGKCELCGPKGK